ncbi:uncharacterized protein VTP21DRAFT_6961 [Calcarisporiella thermophila]|uniref:uncharacterized protein n=1 Tax=Calcarisporiella thermophila TaxID=911321 RepID=UPI0037441847
MLGLEENAADQIQQPQESAILVAVRVRPLNEKELIQLHNARMTPGQSQNAQFRKIIHVLDKNVLVFDPPYDADEDNPNWNQYQKALSKKEERYGIGSRRCKDVRFAFDRVFGEETQQEEVFENTTKGLIDGVLNGFNSTVFAYGATGCGKTHTISGTPEKPGIIFLTMRELFQRIEECADEKIVQISLSYLEIYNEQIRDLLINNQKPLAIREDEKKRVIVAGLSEHHPKDVTEVMNMILKGNANRTMSPTEANATSSRSHAVLQIHVKQRPRTAGVSEDFTLATLSLIDLAGSERASVTKNRGERLLEGANINRSLLALGNCINALCDDTKKHHIPYRDSKLTRLLKFSLGGNCKTVMIVCVSPSSAHYDETHNTLKYANRAKNIKTKVHRNLINVDRHVSQYVKAIYELRQEVADLKRKIKALEENGAAEAAKRRSASDRAAEEVVKKVRVSYESALAKEMEAAAAQATVENLLLQLEALEQWIASYDAHSAEDAATKRGYRDTVTALVMELERHRQGAEAAAISSQKSADVHYTAAIKVEQAVNDPISLERLNLEKQNLELQVENARLQSQLTVFQQTAATMGEAVKSLMAANGACLAGMKQAIDAQGDDGVRGYLDGVYRACITAITEATGRQMGLQGLLQYEGMGVVDFAGGQVWQAPQQKQPLTSRSHQQSQQRQRRHSALPSTLGNIRRTPSGPDVHGRFQPRPTRVHSPAKRRPIFNHVASRPQLSALSSSSSSATSTGHGTGAGAGAVGVSAATPISGAGTNGLSGGAQRRLASTGRSSAGSTASSVTEARPNGEQKLSPSKRRSERLATKRTGTKRQKTSVLEDVPEVVEDEYEGEEAADEWSVGDETDSLIASAASVNGNGKPHLRAGILTRSQQAPPNDQLPPQPPAAKKTVTFVDEIQESMAVASAAITGTSPEVIEENQILVTPKRARRDSGGGPIRSGRKRRSLIPIAPPSVGRNGVSRGKENVQEQALEGERSTKHSSRSSLDPGKPHRSSMMAILGTARPRRRQTISGNDNGEQPQSQQQTSSQGSKSTSTWNPGRPLRITSAASLVSDLGIKGLPSVDSNGGAAIRGKQTDGKKPHWR